MPLRSLYAILVKDKTYTSMPYVSEDKTKLTPILEDTAKKYFIREITLGAKIKFCSDDKIEIHLDNDLAGTVVVDCIQTKML